MTAKDLLSEVESLRLRLKEIDVNAVVTEREIKHAQHIQNSVRGAIMVLLDDLDRIDVKIKGLADG